MEEKKKRPRIERACTALIDPLEYTTNRCTENGRLVCKINLQLEIELWFDAHYISRAQNGDANGKREGIDQQRVKEFIIDNFAYLVHFGNRLQSFKFLNDGERGRDACSIILKKEDETGLPLNVSIQVHHKSCGKYEVTVKTAMCTEMFKYYEGQYVLDVSDESSGTLYKYSQKRLIECGTCYK